MKQILKHSLTTLGVLCLTVGGIAAQSSSFASQEPFKTQYILGVNFMPEWQLNGSRKIGGIADGSGFSPNVGLSFEARIARHSGIETGFYYRNVTSEAGSYWGPDSQDETYPAGFRRYFSIPLLYKYYSRILNVGVGFNYDIMFKQSEIARYWDGKHRVGFMLKVSKDITLYKGLFLEPEFHYNPILSGKEDSKSWIGFQIGLKYRF